MATGQDGLSVCVREGTLGTTRASKSKGGRFELLYHAGFKILKAVVG